MSPLTTHRSPLTHRRGAAAVEFALVAPLFFAMIFGIAEAGRMLEVQQMMTNATREGARRAMIKGVTADEVKTAVINSLGDSGITITAADVTIVPANPDSATNGQAVSVVVDIPFSDVTWLPSPMFSWGGRTLRAFTVMRRDVP